MATRYTVPLRNRIIGRAIILGTETINPSYSLKENVVAEAGDLSKGDYTFVDWSRWDNNDHVGVFSSQS